MSSPNLIRFTFFEPQQPLTDAIPYCARLQELYVGFCSYITDNLLKQIGTNCLELKQLTLTQEDELNTQFTTDGLRYIFHENHKIKYFNLKNWNDTKISQDILYFIADLMLTSTIEIRTDMDGIALALLIKKIERHTPKTAEYRDQLITLRDADPLNLFERKQIIEYFKDDSVVFDVFYEEGVNEIKISEMILTNQGYDHDNDYVDQDD